MYFLEELVGKSKVFKHVPADHDIDTSVVEGDLFVQVRFEVTVIRTLYGYDFYADYLLSPVR